MPRFLRAEARPADWKDLDTTQKDAFKMVVKMIGEAIEQLPKGPPPPQLPDPFQLTQSLSTSQTAFLSGDRGTGKTTVMLSIVKATVLDSRQEIESNDESFKRAVDKMRLSAVWLQTLNMETMPASANLLAAILARVEDSVRRLGGVEHQLFGETPDGYTRALDKLQQLQSGVVLAWDSNLSAREGQLDPDVFVIETARGEKARLSIAEEMEAAFAAISTYCFKSFGLKNPLFVLPVDDIDLNPQACLHLLQLLRMISVPHLFTLILGDEKSAELVLKLKMSSELGRITGEFRNPQQLAVPPRDIGDMAAHIAINAFRKLLPPGQRVRLQVMELLEAFNYRPLNSSDPASRLHHLMEKCRLGHIPPAVQQPGARTAAGSWSFLDFLLGRTQAKQRQNDASVRANDALDAQEIAMSPYETGLGFLRVTPRKLADFWLKLSDITDTSSAPADPAHSLLGVFGRMSGQSLRGDPDMPQDAREMIPAAISQNRKGEWELGPLPIRVKFTTCLRHRIDVPLAATSSLRNNDGEDVLQLRFATDQWRTLETIGTTKSASVATASQPGRRITDAAVMGELAIFHDLLAFVTPPAQFRSPLLPGQIDGPDWASAEWHHGEIGIASIPWPSPSLQTFWGYDCFLSAWNAAIRGKSQINLISAADLAQAWISLGTAAIGHTPDSEIQLENCSLSWGDLGKRLCAMADASQAHSAPAEGHDWLISVAMLLMPECGLAWLPGLETQLARMSANLHKFWMRRENLQLLKRQRALRLAELVKAGMMPLAERLITSVCRARTKKTPLADLRLSSAPSLELLRQLADVAAEPAATRRRRRAEQPQTTATARPAKAATTRTRPASKKTSPRPRPSGTPAKSNA